MKYKNYLKQLMNEIKKPEMKFLPGNLAFFLLLSIIPLVAVIVVLATKLSFSYDEIVNIINSNLPEEISSFILDIISIKNLNINIILFTISGFLLASNGPSSMIICSNVLFNIKNQSELARRIKSIFMTFLLVMLILFILVVPVFGDQIIKFIISITSDKIENTIHLLYSLIKYPLSLLIIFTFIKILYTLAPDEKIKSKDTTKGALFTTLLWILSTEIYSFYVTKIANYSELYGNVANLIILFLWIYLLSYIFVLGMALNATNYKNNNN